ncbi:MAG TPA: hypothetical protein VFN25_11330 [Dokdonella sp.]|uniref:hypothetical protein n=1 Tax=Dokdonella sp. TaxID=2291710 RepID=UPI002D80EF7C|nr:hypothetical protein [Dokdonella sp.]HET9033485.1 hypothetical protein [Dokdonella sp.]
MPRFANLLVAVLLAMSCSLFSTPAAADGSASDALFSAYQKMINSSYSADSVSTDAKGKETRTKVEFETISRFRATTSETSIVVLPEGTWMRSGDGQWMKPPVDMSGMFKRMIPSTIEDIRAGTSNIKDEGLQTIDGQSLRAISYDVNTKVMGVTVSSHNKVFIDDTGRIVRSESDSTAMGHKSHTVQTIHYDDSIKISAPN